MVSLSNTVSRAIGSSGKVKFIRSVDDFILKNVYFLYAIVAFSLLNLMLLSVKGSYVTVLVFIIFGILVSYFSKNMVVILLIANVLSFIFYLGVPKITEKFTELEEKEEELAELEEKEAGFDELEEGFTEGAKSKKDSDEDDD